MFRRLPWTVSACALFAACLLTAAIGCAQTVLEIEDSLGRPIAVHVPVRRMVVLSGDGMEVMRILKAQQLVVGVSDSIVRESTFWKELADRPVVGKWNEPNYELIADLQPDVVLCYGRNPGPEAEQKLRSLGITLLRLDLYRPATLAREVAALGRILGRENEAESFLAWHRAKLDFIEGRVKSVGRHPRVYLESYTDFHTLGPGSGIHEMCLLAGGDNVARGFSIPYAQITSEWVVAENPQVIVKACVAPDAYGAATADRLKACWDSIRSRPVWSETAAVKDGAVHVLAGDVCAGPRGIIGILYMAKWFYPDAMADLDPASLHREYLDAFHRLPYQGRYVYPGED